MYTHPTHDDEREREEGTSYLFDDAVVEYEPLLALWRVEVTVVVQPVVADHALEPVRELKRSEAKHGTHGWSAMTAMVQGEGE
jgi:hypothetical protein